jgi:L-asparaginase
VVVLSTGGTISSRLRDGALVAADGADEIVARLGAADPTPRRGAVDVRGEDVMNKGSYLLTSDDMVAIAQGVRRALADETVIGVVVTHGTDTMEESAYFADLVHDDQRPVVFTGAQRAADMADSDGIRNLADAIQVASDPATRGFGSLILFEGGVFAAAGTVKRQTLASAAFGTNGLGPLGWVWGGVLNVQRAPRRAAVLPLDRFDTGARVDIVPYYPDADTTALRAVVAAGAAGVVLQGTGVGNANPDFCREVERLTADGVVVALSTRVPFGPVAAMYGAGGGIDLVRAGAVPVGTLRSPQARILLLTLLSVGYDPARVTQELRDRTGEIPSIPRTSLARSVDRRKVR